MSSRWIDIPFSPRKSPFFYGWVILAFSTLGTLASVPGQTMGVGVFTDPLIEAFSLSRIQLAYAYALGTITSAFMLPLAGRLIDIHGCRAAIVYSGVGFGICLYFMAVADRMLAASPFHGFAAAFLVATVAFLGVRFFGQGCLTMVSRVMIGKWFNHFRGRATAIAGLFISFGFTNAPFLLHAIVVEQGWRFALYSLAVSTGLLMAAFGWIFYRDNPQECGLVPDGVDDPEWHEKMSARTPDVRHEFERGEALRTAAFWAPTLALSLHGLQFTAFTFHTTDMGVELGLPADNVYRLFLLLPWFSVPANFVCGWLADYIKLKWFLVLMLLCQVIGTYGLSIAGTPMGWFLFSAGYGISGGIFAIMITLPWPRFFGTRHLGAISGLNMSMMVFASAFGPILYSIVHDYAGAYRPIIHASAFVPAFIAVLAYFAENPQERYPEPDPQA
ncbi:MAG: MFS transporter [Candidatus Hydrogenedens sp.]|nr:MFS transporter [Candidatus Hydrogenedens sp.]